MNHLRLVRGTPLVVAWVASLALAGTSSAQSRASSFIKQFGWHTNLEGAKTTARQTGKPIFLVFRCDP